MPIARLRAGIIGTGFMGRVHAAALRANAVDLVGVLGSSPASSRRAADAWGTEPVASIDELVARGADVVHICVPNHLHHDYAAAVITAGLAVVCEKPLATDVQDAAELVALAEDRGVVTAVPFVYRYYGAVRAARAAIRQDPDNALWVLHGSYLQDWLASPEAANWRVDPDRGGDSRAFGDIGVHWCDLMEFVTGQRITRLNARFANAFTRQGGDAANATEDGGVVSFETDAGAIGSVVISQASAGRANRLWFSFDGPRASYSFDQEEPETLWIGEAGGARLLRRSPDLPGSRPDALPAGHPQGYQTCFDDLVGDVVRTLRGETVPNMPTFHDGLRAAALTRAVVDSARGGEWVDVPLDARTPVLS